MKVCPCEGSVNKFHLVFVWFSGVLVDNMESVATNKIQAVILVFITYLLHGAESFLRS